MSQHPVVGAWRKSKEAQEWRFPHHRGPRVFLDQTGVVKCPMTWVYWTSPKIVAIIDHIPNGWVMWNMGTWLMTHVKTLASHPKNLAGVLALLSLKCRFSPWCLFGESWWISRNACTSFTSEWTSLCKLHKTQISQEMWLMKLRHCHVGKKPFPVASWGYLPGSLKKKTWFPHPDGLSGSETWYPSAWVEPNGGRGTDFSGHNVMTSQNSSKCRGADGEFGTIFCLCMLGNPVNQPERLVRGGVRIVDFE